MAACFPCSHCGPQKPSMLCAKWSRRPRVALGEQVRVSHLENAELGLRIMTLAPFARRPGTAPVHFRSLPERGGELRQRVDGSLAGGLLAAMTVLSLKSRAKKSWAGWNTPPACSTARQSSATSATGAICSKRRRREPPNCRLAFQLPPGWVETPDDAQRHVAQLAVTVID